MAAHDYETMKICVDAYLRYVRGIDSTLAEIAEDVARLEARLELMGASFEAAAELSEAKLLCRPVHERRHALWLHSVERLSWDETARRMGYSSAQTRRLAEIGVRELYALMPERWRREPIPNAAPR